MDNTVRREMLHVALNKMKYFTLENSQYSDNRSIFGLVIKLIESVPSETLSDCRVPLAAVMRMHVHNTNTKFQGCKLALLQQTIIILFGWSDKKAFGKEFATYDRDKLLAYIEFCRRIFISRYAQTTVSAVGTDHADGTQRPAADQACETAMQRAFRMWKEKENKRKTR